LSQCDTFADINDRKCDDILDLRLYVQSKWSDVAFSGLLPRLFGYYVKSHNLRDTEYFIFKNNKNDAVYEMCK